MSFESELIPWYRINKRDLPWRNTTDPYKVWLSEIILQQTRVSQGLSYYNKFTEAFPTVFHLAEASEKQVLKLWQGLGYYSRARNLHSTSKVICQDYNGSFPDNYTDLLKLKGVGPYTAAAIASFCFDEKVAVVDGNVYRVISRIFGVDTPIDSTEGKKIFAQKAAELQSDQFPGEFNQAIMEFGATLCTPKLPECSSCPFQNRCFALKNDLIDSLPQKAKKQKVKHVHFNYLVFKTQNGIWLRKRNGSGIWQNLYDFPMVESLKAEQPEWVVEEAQKSYGSKPDLHVSEVSKQYVHLLSHRKIHARFYIVESTPLNFENEEIVEVSKQELEGFPVPRIIENFIDDHLEFL